jgi:hypothetical protein
VEVEAWHPGEEGAVKAEARLTRERRAAPENFMVLVSAEDEDL